MRINSKLCGTILGFALLTAGPVYAAAISGSDTVGASVTSTNETGGNLGTSTTVTLSSIFETFSVLAPGAGSFGVIPLDTTVPLGGTLLNLSTAASFGFISPTVGTFTPTAITLYDQTATSLDIFLTGGFTPGSLFGAGATAPLGASENIGLTQTNGGVISLSGTFASPPASRPPATVPEPLSIALFGGGLVALAGMVRRKKKA